ncbi:hypothetical protein GGR50DRAFT_581286 [Xylaria sp. CBS 124048]|nr:hypothetical protein GGR50DRAFT_581286 [Xylaria sp. CBS 124048]
MIPAFKSSGFLLLAAQALGSIIPGKSSDGYPSYPSACPSCQKPSHCGNEGWDWAYYSNPLTNSGENYPGYRADAFKTKTPGYTSVTPVIGSTAALGADSHIYNSSVTLSSTYFTLNQHAYLWACEAGTWQFDISGVDDIVLAWVGGVAYSGWTDQNANGRAVWSFQGSTHTGSASFTSVLPADTFVPVRFVFGNGQAGGAFRVTITSPSGVIVHQTGRAANNDWIVRYSCPFDPRAPRFPTFGQES